MNKLAVLLSMCASSDASEVKLAVDSILNQIYDGDIRLYIGIDGPVDADVESLVRDYESDEHVSVQWFKENRGLPIVLNQLLDLSMSSGYEYFARMDSDDISLPDRFQKQMEFLEAHPEIDIVGGAISEIDEKGNDRHKVVVYPYGPDDCYRFFAYRNPHAHPAVIFRKSYFEKAGCKYRPEYRRNQDTMLWFDGFKGGTKNANIPDVVLKYRMSDSMFRHRRNGYKFAYLQFRDRQMINKELGYGIKSSLFSVAMLCMLISPAWVKKIAYRVCR